VDRPDFGALRRSQNQQLGRPRPVGPAAQI